jgi:IS30 family transposase
MPVHLTAEQRQLALRLKARGLSLREIGPQVGCSHQGAALIVRRSPQRLVRQDRWVPGPGRLTLPDREEVTLGVHAGESFTVIAAGLGKATSTVSREVAANGGRAQYRAWRAHQRAREQARRPGAPNRRRGPRRHVEVVANELGAGPALGDGDDDQGDAEPVIVAPHPSGTGRVADPFPGCLMDRGGRAEAKLVQWEP